MFLCFAPLILAAYLYFIKNVVISKKVLKIWKKLGEKYFIVFIFLASILTSLKFHSGVFLGEDIGGQVKSSIQWIQGDVIAPNLLLSPSHNDLSKNSSTWCLRPPGASLLPLPGMLLGMSVGNSIQIALFICSIVGGTGWLTLFSKFKIHKSILLLASILCSFLTSEFISVFSSANIILYAIVPWFLVWILKLDSIAEEGHFSFKNSLKLSACLFLLGCFAWIKLSGLIVGGTIAASLLSLVLLNCPSKKRLHIFYKFIFIGIVFWIPFFSLEKINSNLSGKTAEQAYSEVVSDAEYPLTGKYWLESTTSGWLVWSLAAGPGYSLPSRQIAIGFRDFIKQFENARKWLDKLKINEHVLLAGIVSICLTLLLFLETKNAFYFFSHHQKIILTLFFVLPFIGLAIIACRFQWNYLLYHAHTFEFWIIFIIPTMIAISCSTRLPLRSYIFFGIMFALPICNNFETIIRNISPTHLTNKSKWDLCKNRYDPVIEIAEKDSTNPYDILFFMPHGNSSDLIVRTTMRTKSTHFSGDNFPKSMPFSTTKSLNIYCAYDSILRSNKAFIQSLNTKFPQQIESKIICSGDIILRKIKLSNNKNG